MTDGPKAVQEEQADDGVVRALSVAKTVLDAGRAGITRGELRERVESYIELRASGQDDDSFERMFGRDKEYLRATGVPLTEISSAGDYRYSIDPDQYGLPDLRLEPAERLVLRQAHAVFAESNIRGLQHALWALIPEADPQDDVALSAPPVSLQTSIGSEQEIDRLLELAAIGMGGALMFHYTGRGSSSPTERRIVGLGAGVRGHWYLYGFDLDKEAHRVFRMDRIHSHIRPLRRMTPEHRAAADAAAAAAGDAQEDIARVLADIPEHESLSTVLTGVLAAHEGSAPKAPRLRPAAAQRPADAAGAKVDRVINMAAVLLSGQQLRPSELMRRFSITAEQLHRDLLSLGMAGTFGDGYSGDYLEVHPLPPLEPERFRSDYLSRDIPVRLTGPAGTAVDTMSRPVSLTRYGALGVLMALQALERMSAPDDSGTGPAVRSLRRKIAGVVPPELVSAADSMALARTSAENVSLESIRAAAAGGFCVRIRYSDAAGSRTQRVIEPVQIVHDGPGVYVRAWCRQAEGERLFRIQRIEQIETLPDVLRSQRADALARTAAPRALAPRTDESISVVLRFSPPAAGTAERFAPSRIHREKSGTVTIGTHFSSAEAAVGYVVAAGGDIQVLQPRELRQQVYARAQQQLRDAQGGDEARR